MISITSKKELTYKTSLYIGFSLVFIFFSLYLFRLVFIKEGLQPFAHNLNVFRIFVIAAVLIMAIFIAMVAIYQKLCEYEVTAITVFISQQLQKYFYHPLIVFTQYLLTFKTVNRITEHLLIPQLYSLSNGYNRYYFLIFMFLLPRFWLLYMMYNNVYVLESFVVVPTAFLFGLYIILGFAFLGICRIKLTLDEKENTFSMYVINELWRIMSTNTWKNIMLFFSISMAYVWYGYFLAIL